MNLSDLTNVLVLRGFQKKDAGTNDTYVPPGEGRYWLTLPAEDSLDGKNWLWVYPGETEAQISVCAEPDGTVEECSIQIAGSSVGVWFSSVPASLDDLLDGFNRVAAICDHSGDALLSDSLLARRLNDNLPDWLLAHEEAGVDW